MTSSGVGIILLASGASRRFRSDKRFARLPGGQLLLNRMLSLVSASGLPCFVTLRSGEAIQTPGAQPLMLEHASRGMGSSIAEAVASVGENFSALMILPVDLPLLKLETLTALAENATSNTLRRPVADGREGHPVVFGCDYFVNLAALDGEQGAQSILRKYAGSVERITVNDPGIYLDIDTPETLASLTREGHFAGQQ
ncbi:NTP transferase domain-containing protein [Litorivivens sp.]|uniref:nucleotidyltransferase family protein n=1 Tax=Litorivivens sp. TaxID=2020868 RepID=UPI003561B14D